MNKMRRLQLKRITDKLCEIEDELIQVRDAELESYENIKVYMKDRDVACRLLGNYNNLHVIICSIEDAINVINLM